MKKKTKLLYVPNQPVQQPIIPPSELFIMQHIPKRQVSNEPVNAKKPRQILINLGLHLRDIIKNG